jgi:predicted aldo/keto reductase-like oxidoreductase
MGYSHVLRARKRDQFFLNSKISLWDITRNKLYADIFASLPEPEQRNLKAAAGAEIERRKADAPDYFGGYFAGQREELDAAALANVMEKRYGRQIDRGKNYKKLILESVDQTLGRLGTDHLDLVMCPHGASTPHELLNYPEIFEAFEILKKSGKARHLGVSAHTDPAGVIEAAVKARVYSAAMVAYNIVNHAYVDRALAAATKADLGVVAMKVARPVYGGRPSRKDDPARVKLVHDAVPGDWKTPQKAYLWALRKANLSAVISELVNHEMVRENLPLAGRKG